MARTRESLIPILLHHRLQALEITFDFVGLGNLLPTFLD